MFALFFFYLYSLRGPVLVRLGCSLPSILPRGCWSSDQIYFSLGFIYYHLLSCPLSGFCFMLFQKCAVSDFFFFKSFLSTFSSFLSSIAIFIQFSSISKILLDFFWGLVGFIIRMCPKKDIHFFLMTSYLRYCNSIIIKTLAEDILINME